MISADRGLCRNQRRWWNARIFGRHRVMKNDTLPLGPDVPDRWIATSLPSRDDNQEKAEPVSYRNCFIPAAHAQGYDGFLRAFPLGTKHVFQIEAV